MITELNPTDVVNNLNEKQKPLVSILLAGYNEEKIVEKNLTLICNYMRSLENDFRWEIVFVNDGSKDNTGKLVDEFCKKNKNVSVFHHKVNMFLGNALKTGFSNCRGEYIVTIDLDLSYCLDHIKMMLDKIIETDADVVLASPYMKGGKVTNVPFMRALMSRVVNRLLAFTSYEKIHTFTGMVRAYKGNFLRYLNLKARDFEINPEIIYKALLLRGRIVEIPAHLDWSDLNSKGKKRTSSMRMFRGIISGFMSAFIFRPYMFFILTGIILFLISMYVIIWIFVNTFIVYPSVPPIITNIEDRFSEAVAIVFRLRPYSFIVGGITFIVALQFLGIGFLSLQNKRYFEELFHLNTNIFKKLYEEERKSNFNK
jgi:glycosyltransferase involved in cell wall biosynthesis